MHLTLLLVLILVTSVESYIFTSYNHDPMYAGLILMADIYMTNVDSSIVTHFTGSERSILQGQYTTIKNNLLRQLQNGNETRLTIRTTMNEFISHVNNTNFTHSVQEMMKQEQRQPCSNVYGTALEATWDIRYYINYQTALELKNTTILKEIVLLNQHIRKEIAGDGNYQVIMMAVNTFLSTKDETFLQLRNQTCTKFYDHFMEMDPSRVPQTIPFPLDGMEFPYTNVRSPSHLTSSTIHNELWISGLIVVIIAFVTGSIVWKRIRQNKDKQTMGFIKHIDTDKSNSTTDTDKSIISSGWDDPKILSMRIPFEFIQRGSMISSGAFGQIYQGIYKGEVIALKCLLPEKRTDVLEIQSFIEEIQLLASLDHERIVRLIGVAWTCPSDLCALLEYMNHGDLRYALNQWETIGMDHTKFKIATHIAHALAYLHSLESPIVHRDLKPKNIVLNDQYDAKLTDFGISRQQMDGTMTCGIGSALWMAPEVMTGRWYDQSADIFAFGVILSELDTNEMPYTHAIDITNGHKLPETAILEMVSIGELQVSFTNQVDPELKELAIACVALNPKDRPTSGELLYRIHSIWKKYLS